jgi:hypothetical protein
VTGEPLNQALKELLGPWYQGLPMRRAFAKG